MVLLTGTKPALLSKDFTNNWTLIIMILSIMFLNLPLYVLFLVLQSIVVGLSTNLIFTMFFFKAICLKMFSWLNHQDSLTMIILIMCANFTKLSMVLSRHHVLGIVSYVSFLSSLASSTPMLTHYYLSSTLVVSWSISLFMLMTLSL